MMDYAKLLLDAINNYNEENFSSKDNLRDLVCIVSDNEQLKEDPFILNLLYIASQKMRVFGYNIQNALKADPDKNLSALEAIKNEAIKETYRSKVWSNNILDKTQKEIIEFFQSLETKRMLVSAPTSYGKTFLMREILFINRERYNNILLVFPTVALLRENASEMEKFNRDKELDYRVIKSIDSEINISDKNIFVFTPERAMQLIANFPDLKLDFFFYDEVYKIDEDYCYDETDEKPDSEVSSSRKSFLDESRAKTFRVSLYLLSKEVKEFYLAGPNLNKDYFGPGMQEYIRRNNIQVKEVMFEPTMRLKVDAFSKNIVEENNRYLPAKTEPTALSVKVNDRISTVVNYIKINKYGKTMLYCTSPAKANEYATKLSEDRNTAIFQNDHLQIFLEHIKRTYNINGSIKDWSFINVLEKGFAMHHGKLPKYIQTEVLEQFNNGAFDILFCTSTIVEGVNTKAKNMVILNKTKGREKLTPFDIKNIKGRAGRYYHNFIGRVFYMDRELLEIENSEDLILNFATYDQYSLDGIDLDNTDFQDLTGNNHSEKMLRSVKQKNYKLPDEVFIKNRLVKKEDQENLLTYILEDSKSFNGFYELLTYHDLTTGFLKYNFLGRYVLEIFQNAGLIDENTKIRYKAISLSYYNNGFRGILEYEIKNSRKNGTSIDRAYSNAFKTLKDVIEHKIPKLLSLFENIYVCAAKMMNQPIDNFSISRVIRFYETGIRSHFGEQLIEYGFPVDTIRKIEDSHKALLTMSAIEAKNYYLQHKYQILSLLDSYEQQLIEKAVGSIS